MPDLPELKPQEIGLAKQIIQQIQHETWNPEKYKDEVQERMLDLINKKVEGQEITVAPEAPAGKVIDLMAALKASLGIAKDAGWLSTQSPTPPEARESRCTTSVGCVAWSTNTFTVVGLTSIRAWNQPAGSGTGLIAVSYVPGARARSASHVCSGHATYCTACDRSTGSLARNRNGRKSLAS